MECKKPTALLEMNSLKLYLGPIAPVPKVLAPQVLSDIGPRALPEIVCHNKQFCSDLPSANLLKLNFYDVSLKMFFTVDIILERINIILAKSIIWQVYVAIAWTTEM